MKKIFVTGANGFIGRNLKEQLSDYYDVICPTRFELDLLEENKVEVFLKENKFDVIIHTATQNASRNAKENLNLVLERNMRMFLNLARCNDYYGKMLYFGSGAEYDMRYYEPMMREEYFDKNVPVDGYGFSKYIMSKFTNYIENIYDLRIFGCFGKYEDWEIRFISNAVCKAIFNLPITIKQNMYFDYLYIDDLVNITRWFIENKPKRNHYNVSTGKSIDLITIAKIVLEVSGKKEIPIIIKNEGLKPEYSGNNERLLNEIGNYKFTELEKSINDLFDWYNKIKPNINKELLLIDK
jgi:UDP-glucose 4-epimerase